MTASIRSATTILSTVVLSLVSTVALANPNATPRRSFGEPMRLHLAEVEIVNQQPTGTPPAAQAAPVAAAPVAAAPVAPTSSRTEVVHHKDQNYMSTIAVSALMGALAGALVGGSLYYLADDQNHAARIGYWAAGGVLVGTGVGLVQLMVQEGDHATASRGHLPSDPAPTFRLALLNQRF
jgi:hypothetical protein